MKRELIDLSDEVWKRTRARVDGLTDDEYFWEPAPGCWSIRRRPDGTWIADWPLPRPDPEPFTTIAWRLWHLVDMYGEDRAPRWLGLPPQGPPIGLDDPNGSPPATATEAVELLERAHARWDAHLHLVSDDQLREPVGDVAGPHFASRSRIAYVLHMLDEFVHHGAEIALLRDLWRWQHPVGDDAGAERVMRGDASLLDDLTTPATADLVDLAARYGRWDLVVRFVEQGAPINTTGATAPHFAAGAGELDVVKLLLDRGADAGVTDPDFRATPRQWAVFLRHPEVAEYLAGRDRPADS